MENPCDVLPRPYISSVFILSTFTLVNLQILSYVTKETLYPNYVPPISSQKTYYQKLKGYDIIFKVIS